MKRVPEYISIPAEILVLVGGIILPAPNVPSITRTSTRLKRVLGRASAVNVWLGRRWLNR